MTDNLRNGFRIKNKVVRPNEGYIEDSAGLIGVEPKFMDVLVCLAEHAGEVVDRDTLIRSVWRTTVVSDDSVNRSISQLRTYLGDDSRNPQFIETVPKCGYRLASRVHPLDSEDKDGPLPETPKGNVSFGENAIGRQGRHVAGQIGVGIVAGVVAAAIAVMVFRPQAPSESIAAREAFNPPSMTIAVMPFQDQSENSETTHLGDGIAEDLLSILANVDDLRVVARSSSFAFRGADTDVRTIGRALNVGALLEGSVSVSDDRIHLTAGLLDTTSGYQVWSKSFDEHVGDTFAIQEEIARAVVRQLDSGYNLPDQLIISSTNEFDAYDRYLLGRHNLLKRTPASLREAVRLFVLATDTDPEYGLAWAGLLEAYVLQVLYAGLSIDDAKTLSSEAFSNSMRFGEHHYQTHAAHGLFFSYVTGDLEASVAARARAREMNPNDPVEMRRDAVVYESLGQPQLGIELLDRAIRLDPLNQHIRIYRISTLMQLGRVDEAMVAFDEGPWIGGPSASALRTMATWIGANGDPVKGLSVAKQAFDLDPDGPITISALIQMHLQLADLEEANKYLTLGMQHSPDALHFFVWSAKLAYAVNDIDRLAQITSAYLDATRPGDDRAVVFPYLWGLYYGGLSTLLAGDNQIAISYLDEWYQHYLARTLSVPVISTLEVMSFLAVAYERGGQHQRAQQTIAVALKLADQVHQNGRADPVFQHIRVSLFALNGEVDKAIELLQETLSNGPTSGRRGHVTGFWSIRVDPTLDNLRDDERFQRLLARVDDQVRAMRESL